MDEPIESEVRPHHRPWLKALRLTAGWLCITIAVVGLIIPVMPHTPFLALGAILLAPYVRLFRRLSAWVHKHFPRMRRHLRPFRIFKRPLRKATTPAERAAR